MKYVMKNKNIEKRARARLAEIFTPERRARDALIIEMARESMHSDGHEEMPVDEFIDRLFSFDGDCQSDS